MLTIPTVEQSPTRVQLLEALSRLRQTPECKKAQAYADLLLALDAKRREDPEYQRYAADPETRDAVEYRR